MAFVGAPRLADLGLVPGHVEDVVDDLEHDSELGREAPERHCGRSVHTFERQGKRTYVSEFGLERARELAVESHEKARAALADAPGRTETLARTTDYILTRRT